jgi:aspartyl/asparaginyl beta-hydroxylase (cupin superfamily)
MADWLAERFRHHIISGVEGAGFPKEAWPARFREALAIMFGERERDLVVQRYPQLPRLFFYPGLPYVDFADVAQFHWRKELESRHRELRDEASDLLADTSDFSPYVKRSSEYPQGDVYGLVENPSWSSLYLWNSGEPIEENVARCPRTFAAMNEIVPQCEIRGKFPSVLFSLLKPGAHIPPHNGMLNIQYICHLPLIVPPNCRFRVGESTVEWHEGKMLAFDDTVEHEARNDSDQDRLILLFYIWNPFLSDEEQLLVRTMLEVVHDYR